MPEQTSPPTGILPTHEFVDGKVGVRPAAEVQDAAGAVVYRLKGRLMGVPKILTVSDSEGDGAMIRTCGWLSAG